LGYIVVRCFMYNRGTESKTEIPEKDLWKGIRQKEGTGDNITPRRKGKHIVRNRQRQQKKSKNPKNQRI